MSTTHPSRPFLAAVILATVVPLVVAAQSPRYPTTRRDSVVEDHFGIKVSDPYRWLETDRAETATWVQAQRDFTDRYLARLSQREWIRRRLTALSNDSRTGVPWREAGHIFFTENAGLRHQPVLYVQGTAEDSPQVVLDPQTLSPDGSTAVSDFAVSPDGQWLTYTMSPGGTAGETHVRNLATGRDLPDVMRGTLGSVCWTSDGGGFFYVRRPAAKPGDAPNAARIEKQLFYHVLGRRAERDRLLHAWKDNYRWLYCMLSDEGRRAIIVAQRGATDRMYTMDLGDPRKPNLSAPLVPLLGDREAGHTPMGTVGDTLYVFTKLGAPRDRAGLGRWNRGDGADRHSRGP